MITSFEEGKSATEFGNIEDRYSLYIPSAYGVAIKILRNPEQAEDAVQDAFLKFWRNPNSYDPQQSFLKWFLTVVRNTCIDMIRRKKHKQFQSIYQEDITDGVISIIDEGLSPEEEVWLSLQRSEIKAALKALPALQKYFIELAFFNGMTHNQIASLTGNSLGAVKGQIRQGLLKLKIQLDADKVLDDIAGAGGIKKRNETVGLAVA